VITECIFNHTSANYMNSIVVTSNVPSAADLPSSFVKIANNTILNSGRTAITISSFNSTIEANLIVNCTIAFKMGGGSWVALNNIQIKHNVSGLLWQSRFISSHRRIHNRQYTILINFWRLKSLSDQECFHKTHCHRCQPMSCSNVICTLISVKQRSIRSDTLSQ
jgi:hypothetical protein